MVYTHTKRKQPKVKTSLMRHPVPTFALLLLLNHEESLLNHEESDTCQVFAYVGVICVKCDVIDHNP